MAQSGQRKCLCCAQYFYPDHRNRERQRFCSTTACRHASKAASQAAWLKPQNNGYFCDPMHVARVQLGVPSIPVMVAANPQAACVTRS